jgi:hypothetical protein
MKAYEEVNVQIHIFFTSGLAGGEWQGSRPLYRRRRSPRYPLDMKLGGPQMQFGRCGEENSNSNPSVVQPIASRYTN